MSVLELKNVSYTYKGSDRPVVRNVNCRFEPGILYAVVGPSGSGKSTLLSMLAGLDLPTEGAVEYDGISLAEMDLDRYRRESISMIFQAFQLFPLLTVLENVCYPMELNAVPLALAKTRAGELLECVGISREKHRRFPPQLSGGEQQRVAIARALGSGAKLLLADEPTGNLDVANTQNVMAILSHLAREKDYCVIVVTHDLEVAAAADRVFRMKDGVLTEEDKTYGESKA